jgi:hypothetical protein
MSKQFITTCQDVDVSPAIYCEKTETKMSAKKCSTEKYISGARTAFEAPEILFFCRGSVASE